MNNYYQIQMGMGMAECEECDFFVWTKVDSVLLTVPFDERKWEEIKFLMKTFHWGKLVPEYFAMRTPRNLHAIDMWLCLPCPLAPMFVVFIAVSMHSVAV